MRKLHKIILTCLCVKFQINHTADITNANSKWHEERERAQRHQTHHDSILPALDRRPYSPWWPRLLCTAHHTVIYNNLFHQN